MSDWPVALDPADLNSGVGIVFGMFWRLVVKVLFSVGMLSGGYGDEENYTAQEPSGFLLIPRHVDAFGTARIARDMFKYESKKIIGDAVGRQCF